MKRTFADGFGKFDYAVKIVAIRSTEAIFAGCGGVTPSDELKPETPAGHMGVIRWLAVMRTPFKSLLVFLSLFGLMYWALFEWWNDGLSHWVIDVATVKPAAWVARMLSGDTNIVAAGAQLRSPRGSINVLYGCDGSDVWMLLTAGLLAAPMGWRFRLMGLAVGSAVVLVLNQARVLSLFFAIRRHSTWFASLHGLIAPLVVVVLVTAFYWAWLRFSMRRASDRATPV
jgi:exosortase/archaeosortase family protein